MPITDEQAKQIKEQLRKHVEQNFEEDKREEVLDYINSLDNQKLEEFLIKNKMIKAGEDLSAKPSAPANAEKPEKQDCVMCLLATKNIPSLSIYEDKDYIASLEINPYSRGHVILIPKKHISETKSLKPTAFSLADKIGKHLVKQLKAENFQISSSDELKHAIINIIPTYKGKELSFKRAKAEQKELQELAIAIGAIKKKEAKPKTKAPKKQAREIKENPISPAAVLRLPRRIP